MKLASVTYKGSRRLAVVLDGGERFGLLDPRHTDLIALIETGTAVDADSDLVDTVKRGEIELLAPIPQPRRNIMCVGKNYSEHAKEFARSGYEAGAVAGKDIDDHPALFSKLPSSVIAPNAAIELHPSITQKVDYEAELAVIIGKGGRGISKEDAYGHIWGYTIVNDVTARDLQKNHKQWFLGKSLDTFAPMGPYVVTADEIDPENTTVQCHVNGELRQNANTRDLIFDIPTLIATLSAGITLQPGDIIATGTPAGVGIGLDPPVFLKSGDIIAVTISGIGTLENRCA
ncbi:fumarylacetoacetate hydrolase family protein [Rhizobium sp. EC-SD404]|uniref:fumarylacetoacetate hydrolase family protein n=1 Tax=Rhizobium sp. EC-SD404 TaxID=2038389 RepID=UPI00125A04FB|nr:fumarylacetoacetate hydrolase family protein [Rhizobium sp. EC-SD404]VVS97122.1 Hydrolase [Rhizobium sp. EC-SD404]